MADVLNDDYWKNEFDVTRDDLGRILKRMREEKRAFTLTELTKRLIRGRLEHGEDYSEGVLPDWIREENIPIWDPAGQWEEGQKVIIASIYFDNYTPHIAVVSKVIKEYVFFKVPDITRELQFPRAKPGSPEAINWYRGHRSRVLVQRESRDLDDQASSILHGHPRVPSRLLTALQQDPRFINLEEKWFGKEFCESLSDEQKEGLYKRMVKIGKALPIEQMLPMVGPSLPEGDIGRFSLQVSLLENEKGYFENTGTAIEPLWKAIPPPPPPWQEAIARYYAYDPDTYQILVEPGQRLTQKLAHRLQELELYAYTVAPVDE